MSAYITDCRKNMPLPFHCVTPAEKDTVDAGIGRRIDKADLTADSHIYNLPILLQCLYLLLRRIGQNNVRRRAIEHFLLFIRTFQISAANTEDCGDEKSCHCNSDNNKYIAVTIS